MSSKKKSSNRSRIINFVFFGVLLVLLLSTTAKSWLLRGVLNTGIFSAKISKKDPETAVKAMPLVYSNESGNMESTENFAGEVVFINFWASWCPPCIAEMPSMNKMYNKMKEEDNLRFVFINLDDDYGTAQKFLRDKNFDIPLHRPEGYIATDLYTGTLPTTVVLNKNGRVVMKHTGMADYNADRFLKQLNNLMKE